MTASRFLILTHGPSGPSVFACETLETLTRLLTIWDQLGVQNNTISTWKRHRQKWVEIGTS